MKTVRDWKRFSMHARQYNCQNRVHDNSLEDEENVSWWIYWMLLRWLIVYAREIAFKKNSTLEVVFQKFALSVLASEAKTQQYLSVSPLNLCRVNDPLERD